MQDSPLSRREAGDALDQVLSMDRRVREFQGARFASPLMITWGVVWFVANAITGLAPRYGARAWMIGLGIGSIATLWITIVQSRRRDAVEVYTAEERAAIGRRFSILGAAIGLFLIASIAVLHPMTGKQGNAWLSLFWACVYMASGAWLGTRMLITGLVTAAAVLVGFFYIHTWYALWMAFFGGGPLLLAGFWLRKP
jgi:hypothetical protein